jgi:DNA mismatch repair protein MutL
MAEADSESSGLASNSNPEEEIPSEERQPIIQLDDHTIGMIAAGEVVERPAQVVKELAENSVDAGSKRIVVEIERGGFDRITVSDDGGGIPESELELAPRRHATSKLSRAEDLSAIHTLGFRGEALASIGMVSRLTIQSRPPGAEGREIICVEGDVDAARACGMAEGTRIEVQGLFENQPARLAFQRRPATETASIVDVLTAQALCNPEIAFRLTVDGRLVLDTPASAEPRERLFDLLGSASDRMLTLNPPTEDEAAPGTERWSGWISPPEISRGRGDDIHIIINGRPVAAQPFLKAIRRGFHTRLMVGRHPVCVLLLDIPAAEVDVNVHPTKREVRLRNSWRVLERLERAIKETLQHIPTDITPDHGSPLSGISATQAVSVAGVIPDSTTDRTTETDAVAVGWRDADADPATEPTSEQMDERADERTDETTRGNSEAEKEEPAWARLAAQISSASSSTEGHTSSRGRSSEGATADIQTKIAYVPPTRESELDGEGRGERPLSSSPLPQQTLPGMESEPIAPALSSAERDLHRHAHAASATSPVDEPELEGEVDSEVPVMKPLAQFADSYILAQGADELFLVDQHALHERVRYERLRHQMTSWESVQLILPLELELTPRQKEVVRANGERLTELGFRFSDSDYSGISAVPELLSGSRSLLAFFEDLLLDLQQSNEDSVLDSANQLQDHIAFMRSCRGAVKANQKLSLAEMRRLLADMRSIDNPWACVHGRPTVLRISAHHLDSHFGRHG